MNYLLVIIGALLFALSITLILIGSFYRKKTVSKSSTEIKTPKGCKYSIIPLRLQFDSEIEGEITVSKGELQFTLEDFFGWIPVTPIQWKSGSYDRWSGNGKHQFKGKCNAGDYMFNLMSKSEGGIEGKLEYSVTYYIPRLNQLVDLGLAFVEVSVPLLVTGLVI
jgi:hypothetical protein